MEPQTRIIALRPKSTSTCPSDLDIRTLAATKRNCLKLMVDYRQSVQMKMTKMRKDFSKMRKISRKMEIYYIRNVPFAKICVHLSALSGKNRTNRTKNGQTVCSKLHGTPKCARISGFRALREGEI